MHKTYQNQIYYLLDTCEGFRDALVHRKGEHSRLGDLVRTDEFMPTSVGEARVAWYPGQGKVRAVLAAGHGTATGIEAPDLQALAKSLPAQGITVALVEQPYRVVGDPSLSGPTILDAVWRELWPRFESARLPVIAGGRSAGSQVACRTARDLKALAVLALSYPLNGPGQAGELLDTGLPTLIVQGGHDPFGRPAQFPTLPATMELVEIPQADHVFHVPYDRQSALGLLTTAVSGWLDRQLLPAAGSRGWPMC
jgi:predicted alpha/beta-hydrolase family hydrolase